MNKLLSIIGTIVFVLLPQMLAYAGDWLVDGPVGGNISALAIHPDEPYRLHAGTDDGALYRSLDYGTSWEELTPGLGIRGIRIACLTFYPANPDILYAGTTPVWETGGLFRSLDRGETWDKINDIGDAGVHKLLFDPTNPAILYAATENGVYKSADGGSNWTGSSEGLQHTFVKSLAIHPEKSNLVYAGTWRQVYKSLDQGNVWNLIPSGMETDSDIFDLVIDPTTPATVYAATCNGVFRTNDGGSRWKKFAESHGLSAIRVQTLVISQHHPKTLYAGTTGGVFRSRNNGGSWQRLTRASIIVSALCEDPSDAERIYAGVEGAAILKTEDGGKTWFQSAQGIVNTHVRNVVLDPKNPAIVYAGTLYGQDFGGVFRSADGGVTWERRSSGLTDTNIESLVIHPENSETLYAGTYAGLFTTSDSGQQWSQIGKKIFDEIRISSIVCLASETLYVGTWKGVFRSHDAGKTWEKLWELRSDEPGESTKNSTPAYLYTKIYALLIDATGHRIYAGTDQGIYISYDDGRNWKVLNPFLTQIPVTSLVGILGNTELILAGTPTGLYYTGDAGQSWTNLTIDLAEDLPVGAIAIDLHRPQHIYIGSLQRHGVFATQNLGSTWEQIDWGSITYNHVWALATDPVYPGKLYVGTSGAGVYRYVPEIR